MIFALLWKTLIQDLLEGLSGVLNMISKSLMFNIEEFESRIPGIGIISDIVRIIAFMIIIVNLYHLAVKNILVPFSGNEREHPLKGLARVFLSVIGIIMVKEFVQLVFTVFQGNENVPGVLGLVDGFFANAPDLGENPADISTAIKNLHGIIPTGLFGFIVVFLLFESTVIAIVMYIERYVMTAFYFYLSPIAIACISSSDTSSVFTNWLKGLLGQLFAVTLSVVLIRLYQWKLISLSTLAQIEGTTFIIDYVIAMVLIGLVASGDRLLSMFGIKIPSALEVAGRVGSAAHHISHVVTMGTLTTALSSVKGGLIDFAMNHKKSAEKPPLDAAVTNAPIGLGMKQHARQQLYAKQMTEKREPLSGTKALERKQESSNIPAVRNEKDRIGNTASPSLSESSHMKAAAISTGAVALAGINTVPDVKTRYEENFRDAITDAMEKTLDEPALVGKPQHITVGGLSFDYSLTPGRIMSGDRLESLMQNQNYHYDSANALLQSVGITDFKAAERSYAIKEDSGVLFYGTCLPNGQNGCFYITDQSGLEGKTLSNGNTISEDYSSHLPSSLKERGEHIYSVSGKSGESIPEYELNDAFVPKDFKDPAVNIHQFDNYTYGDVPVDAESEGLEPQRDGEDNSNYIQRIMEAITRFLMKKEDKK